MNQTTLKTPPEAGGKLGWGVRFAYGCGDTACNLVFGMMSTILTLFYTDYAGIPAATVGLVMLLSRVFDGVSDMIMGVVVEHTHSKWGKSRPWLLWMSVPFAVSAVLLFTVPHTTPFLQFLYIFVCQDPGRVPQGCPGCEEGDLLLHHRRKGTAQDHGGRLRVLVAYRRSVHLQVGRGQGSA